MDQRLRHVPALDAKAAGFKVYAVINASGDPSEMVSRTTLARSRKLVSCRPQPMRCSAKSPDVESSRGRRTREIVRHRSAELRGGHGELQKAQDVLKQEKK